MVRLSLLNKLFTQHGGLGVAVLFFYSSILNSQNYFNKRYDYDEALFSKITTVKAKDDFIYSTGWGITDPDVNRNFGIFFSKFDLRGNVVNYKYYTDTLLSFSCCLQDNFIVDDDKLIFAKRGTDSNKNEVLFFEHDFSKDSTNILASYSPIYFDDMEWVPSSNDIVKLDEGHYAFSLFSVFQDQDISFLIFYNNGQSHLVSQEDFKIFGIEKGQNNKLFTYGSANTCVENDCGTIYLGVYDENGNEITKIISEEFKYLHGFNDFIINDRNNLVLLGVEYANRVDFEGDRVYENVIMEYDEDLNFIKRKVFKGDSWLDFRYDDIVESPNKDGYVLAGFKRKIPDTIYRESYGYLTKLDYKLDTIWSRKYNNLNKTIQRFENISVSQDGGYVIGGAISLNEIIEEEQPIQAWLLKVNSYGLFTPEFTSSSKEIVKNYDKVNIYPNPNHGSIILEEIDTPPLKYVITNSSGQEVYHLDSHGGNITHFVDLDIASGIYFVQIWSDGSLLDTRKIVVQN